MTTCNPACSADAAKFNPIVQSHAKSAMPDSCCGICGNDAARVEVDMCDRGSCANEDAKKVPNGCGDCSDDVCEDRNESCCGKSSGCGDEIVARFNEEGSCCGDCEDDDRPADKATTQICTSMKALDIGYNISSCIAAEPRGFESLITPDCCDGKLSPCCDQSCLERLALQSCESEVSASHSEATHTDLLESSTTRGPCGGQKNGVPCAQHVRAVHDVYAKTLQAFGCLCRILLALDMPSCCDRQEGGSPNANCRRHFKPAIKPCMNSCCAATGSSNTIALAKSVRRRSRAFQRRTCTLSKDCDEARSCCVVESDDLDDCCASEKPATPTQHFARASNTQLRANKLEKGICGGEHVIVSITGMTCTGCEVKLKRTLETMDSVKNLKTSLILARAEFDVDPGAESVSDIIKRLEHSTNFKCERILDNGTSVEVVVPRSAIEFVNYPWPDGVREVVVIAKGKVRISYDASVVGVRDLLKNGWEVPLCLAPEGGDPTLEAGRKHVRQVGYTTLLSIALTVPVLVLTWAPLPSHEVAYGAVSLGLATAVQVVVAGPFYPQALKSLVFSRMLEMDLLIVLSTSMAYVFSVVSYAQLVAGTPLATGEFFETSTLLVTLIVLGRYIGALARQRAVAAVSVRSLQARTALLVSDTVDDREIDARLLQHGDVFKVLPDTRVPTDGTVLSGRSELDESMITGESRPVAKAPGSSVVAGSTNGSGSLVVRATRLPNDNTISTIARMVDEAKLSKPRLQLLADRFTTFFVPTIILLAIITFAAWIAVGIAGSAHMTGGEATVQAITYAITVLIVSCPCAIGLAVPMVVVIASGVAADRGIILKSGDCVESAYRVSSVIFDKTGTLTQGKLTVVAEDYLGNGRDVVLPLLLGLVNGIKHPVSAAVVAHLKAMGVQSAAVSGQTVVTGKGVSGTSADNSMFLQVGNSRWLGFSEHSSVKPMLGQGCTVVCFAINNALVAVMGLRDTIRDDAIATVSELCARRISVHILSGDDDAAVHAVATSLGVHSDNVRARCTPADKRDYIRKLQTTSAKTRAIVLFCGDGTNDAVALAQSDIGVHLNENGNDVANAAADVVLIRPVLFGVLTMMEISRKAVGRIRFNFAWSAVYNVFAILFASGALVQVHIPPEYAGLGELASVLPVIAAAVFLRWAKYE
ncbi:copper-translocating P-type ATPase [Limtongia smithiae]|uniref:copper-translocating P-type ATPase n=1 Tax=Limtongia smithiae TaxID=1125753 RepID=UPI0034CFC452